MYTTQLQAGLGLIDETRTLLELWKPGMTPPQLFLTALRSGRFPRITARRLGNIVTECFAPRYLCHDSAPAIDLTRMLAALTRTEFEQLLLLFTARANEILGEFIRSVYWQRYAGGYLEVSSADAISFVNRAIDDGKTVKRWSESTVRRVASYLTGCCADYGLLEPGRRTSRRILPYYLSDKVAIYLAYDLHFSGCGDNAILAHEDWRLFGLNRDDVLERMKRIALSGALIVQAAGEVIHIGWAYPDRNTVCDVLSEI